MGTMTEMLKAVASAVKCSGRRLASIAEATLPDVTERVRALVTEPPKGRLG